MAKVSEFAFRQVDVFSADSLLGNPVAVVHGADALTDAQMAQFARWTNLSETTFLLKPTVESADYRLRIFTPAGELPFAGHPTLGSCHAWLEAGGRSRGERVVQECGAGLVSVRRDGEVLAFSAPALRRSGAVDPAVLWRIAAALGLEEGEIRASNWVDNGPGFVGLLLSSRERVLSVVPDYGALGDMQVGLIGPWEDGDAQYEVRAFVPGEGIPEDPVTGSLNAGLGQWLIGAGIAPERYVAAQGTVLGRMGRVTVWREGGDIWVGGHSVTCIVGRLTLQP